MPRKPLNANLFNLLAAALISAIHFTRAVSSGHSGNITHIWGHPGPHPWAQCAAIITNTTALLHQLFHSGLTNRTHFAYFSVAGLSKSLNLRTGSFRVWTWIGNRPQDFDLEFEGEWRQEEFTELNFTYNYLKIFI